MKKLIICAAAAIVALASCSKTQVINTEDPKEIGFKTITGVMTKAEQKTGVFTQDLGVIAYYTYGGTEKMYFDNSQFTRESGQPLWDGVAKKYWPLQGTLDFIVYSPYQSGSVVVDKKITLVVDNSAYTSIGNQVDYLYGGEYVTGKEKSEDAVSVELKHALAKVTLNFKGTPGITVNSVELEKPCLKGTYSVNYLSSSIAPVWSSTTQMGGNLLLSDFVGKSLEQDDYQSVSIMVVPAEASKILLTYSLPGSEYNNNSNMNLKAEIPLNEDWESGKQYTYNITMTTYEIKVDTKVVEWVDKVNDDKTL